MQSSCARCALTTSTSREVRGSGSDDVLESHATSWLRKFLFFVLSPDNGLFQLVVWSEHPQKLAQDLSNAMSRKPSAGFLFHLRASQFRSRPKMANFPSISGARFRVYGSPQDHKLK